jgi:hypothetical protein
MRLKELRAKGGFVDTTPVKKNLNWERTGPDGETLIDNFDIFVKRQSFGTIERLLLTDDKDPDRSRSARYIAECVLLGDDGKEALSYADAYALDPTLAKLFIQAINEVNGVSSTPKP